MLIPIQRTIFVNAISIHYKPLLPQNVCMCMRKCAWTRLVHATGYLSTQGLQTMLQNINFPMQLSSNTERYVCITFTIQQQEGRMEYMTKSRLQRSTLQPCYGFHCHKHTHTQNHTAQMEITSYLSNVQNEAVQTQIKWKQHNGVQSDRSLQYIYRERERVCLLLSLIHIQMCIRDRLYTN